MMMKFFNKNQYWFIGLIAVILLGLAAFRFLGITHESLPVVSYYEYDQVIPLKDSVTVAVDSSNFQLLSVTFTSVNNRRVNGLLSLPKNTAGPFPIIILLHGLGDHKMVDYVEFGTDVFLKNGYAVMRIDICDHGERKGDFYDFDLTGPYKYWSRNIIHQTVFDLRRTIDFLESRQEIDATRIGYYGISLGGIIGSIFCGVDNRVKVPIIALAGGQLNLLYERDAFSIDSKNFVSTIEPINFISHISPRPLLMLNAENDEIVPPLMSKLLFNKAEEPKEIIWYNAKHRDAPLDKIYGDGLDWFNKYL